MLAIRQAPDHTIAAHSATMLGLRPRRPPAPETTAPDSVLTIAVYHRSDKVEDHVSDLRLATGMRLEVVKKGALWTVPSEAAAVLWELAPEDGAQRLVSALIAGLRAPVNGESLELPATVTMELYKARTSFTFAPDGSAAGDSLLLRGPGGEARLLTLDPWTGRVRVR